MPLETAPPGRDLVNFERVFGVLRRSPEAPGRTHLPADCPVVFPDDDGLRSLEGVEENALSASLSAHLLRAADNDDPDAGGRRGEV